MPIIRDIINGAVRQGANMESLLQTVGLTQQELMQSEQWVDFETAHLVWSEAVRLTNNDFLGLHLGNEVMPSMIGLTGHLMQTSPTLKTALEHVCKFNELFTDMFHYSLKKNGSLVEFIIEPARGWVERYPETARQARDQAASGTLNVCRLLSGKGISPVVVSFRDRGYQKSSVYESILQCPVKFNAGKNSISFNAGDLEYAIATRDQKLFETFHQILEQQRAANSSSYSDRIMSLFESVYGLQTPSLTEIAAQLNTTSRSLQRRLADEDTTYRQIVDEHRERIARHLLNNTPSSIKRIASVLGYSDASTFRRAFKKWIGDKPKNFRKRSSS